MILSGNTGKPVSIPVNRAEFDAFIAEKQAQSKAKGVTGPSQRVTDPTFSKK